MGTAIDDHAPRLEALYAKRLLAFGGRKSEKPPTPIIRTNDDGKPLATKSEIADHALPTAKSSRLQPRTQTG
eukprot:286972-Pyramimonas_sp.AAC.1